MLVPAVREYARNREIIDTPGGHKSHRAPVPYLGGVAMVAAFSVAMVIGVVVRRSAQFDDGQIRITFGNLEQAGGPQHKLMTLSAHIASQFDASVSWKDLDWLRSLWPGKLAIKGILHPADARLAVEHGADAIIVSNHGGRQLDSAPSAIAALPDIVAAVDGRASVLMDGGVRRGSDVVKAMALGASACLIGRAGLYGLAAGGEAGVTRAVTILQKEIDIALALLGVPDISRITRAALR